MTRSNVSSRRDHSIVVIAFMMALVFVPVLALHAASAVEPDAASAAIASAVDGLSSAARVVTRIAG